MKQRWIVWLVGIGASLAAGLWLSDSVNAQAGAAVSSCSTCHELEGKNPVGDTGAWHVQHSMGDLCKACHDGHPQAAEQDAAHAGVIANPLADAATVCSTCHPEDFAARADQYIGLSSTPAAAATPTGQPSPTPSAKPAAPMATSPAPDESTAAGLDWFAVLRFARGPLFQIAQLAFAAGMLYRIAQVLRLGWKPRRASGGGNKLAGIVSSFVKGLLVLPFVPWVKGAFRHSPITYLAGAVFHLGLLAVIFLSHTHILVWKGLLGFDWPALPQPVIDWMAAGALVALVALFINRLVHPVLKLISGPADWLNWLLVFLPMATGFVMARGWWLPYEAAFSLHMLLVDMLLVWIPASRISHCLFYFFSRTIHGIEFRRRAAVR